MMKLEHWGVAAPGLQHVAVAVAVLWGLVQLASTVTRFIDPFDIRVVHLSFALVLTFLLKAGTTSALSPTGIPARRMVDVVAIVATIVAGAYLFVESREIAERIGVPTRYDIVFGVVELVLVLEASRRLLGWGLTSLALAFLAYVFFGEHLPGLIGHGGYSATRIFSSLYMSENGIWGIPLAVSATYVMLFVLFGAFLQQTGAGQFFVEASQALLGWTRGGPAKMAVVTSALFGMISGSAVSNVVTTGTFTIPLMKRIGYRPVVAGAIEAAASTGGQFTPPIMGASAFIMAQTLGIPYTEVIVAAALPALLFYVCLLFAVDLEAKKSNLAGIPKSELTPFGQVFRGGWYLLIPLIVMLWLLLDTGVSADFAGFWAIIATVVVGVLNPRSRMTARRIVSAFVDGAKATLQVAVAGAAAGVIVGVVSLTGLGLKFSALLLEWAGGNLILTLVLAAGAALILGMGLTTTTVYIIVSVLIAPVLIDLGITPIAAHLFIMYFGVISTITPPVAISAYAAASLSGASPTATGIEAFKLGLVSFVIPFAFAMSPSLLLLGEPQAVILATITALVGSFAIAAATRGIWLVALQGWERALLLCASLPLLVPGWQTDVGGAVALTVVLANQVRAARSGRRTAPQERKSP